MQSQTSVDHILVLDDDEVMRELLDAILTQGGYRVTLATSGEHALQQLGDGLNPHLVLTDVQMPGLSGEALAGALRSALAPGTLLIGMSGSDLPARARAVYDAFLPKPFDREALEAAIATAQHRSADLRQVATTPAAEKPTPGIDAADGDSAAPALDETIFQALAKKIPAPQLDQLYTMTLADIAKRHTRMEAAAAAGNLPSLRHEAHTIKGSCGFVGAAELQALAAALETGTIPSTSALAEIPAACLRLRSMLKSKLHTA